MKKYTILHFSQSLPSGPGQSDISNLLKHISETIRKLGPEVIVNDLVLHSDIDENGEDHPYITVYYDKRAQ